jgi:hypothetical protein
MKTKKDWTIKKKCINPLSLKMIRAQQENDWYSIIQANSAIILKLQVMVELQKAEFVDFLRIHRK